MKIEPDYRSISPDKAKELLKSGKARPTQGAGLVDVPSMILSLTVFVILVISVTVYYEVFSDPRVIKDYVPQAFPVENYVDYQPEVKQIPQLLEQKNYNEIDRILAPMLYNDSVKVEFQSFLWMYAVEIRLAQLEYEQALEMSRVAQSRFVGDTKVLASVLWYRAHAYYQLKRFLDAHQQFATVAIMNDERFSAQALIYQDEIYQIIRTDGINALFD